MGALCYYFLGDPCSFFVEYESRHTYVFYKLVIQVIMYENTSKFRSRSRTQDQSRSGLFSIFLSLVLMQNNQQGATGCHHSDNVSK